MATAKSGKKKRGGSAKKPDLVSRKKKIVKRPAKKPVQKKVIREKGVEKKAVGKKVKKMVEAIKPPQEEESILTADQTAIKKTLLEMREKLLEGISESRIPEPLTTQSDIGDLVDQAGDERDRELSLLLSARDKEKLFAINGALEKLKEGTYGICEECGDKIGAGRLRVMPLAKFCVSCQAKLEKEISLETKAEEDLTYRGLAYTSGVEEEES